MKEFRTDIFRLAVKSIAAEIKGNPLTAEDTRHICQSTAMEMDRLGYSTLSYGFIRALDKKNFYLEHSYELR